MSLVLTYFSPIETVYVERLGVALGFLLAKGGSIEENPDMTV